MVHLGDCVADCPRFYMANFAATKCYPVANLDAKIIYFPFVGITVVAFFLSYVGFK